MPGKITPRVLNQHVDRNGVYIGRPSKFGNPFIIGQDGTRDEVIQKYRDFLVTHPDLVLAAKRELKGQNLVCWCAPQACHGDVLLEVANS